MANSQTPKRVTGDSPGCMLALGLGALVLFVFMLLNAINEEQIFTILISAAFTIGSLWFIVKNLRVMMSRRRVGKPEITLSKTNVRVGDSFTLTFENTFQASVDVSAFTVTLNFRESATYQQGTDTRTVTHNEVIQTFEHPGGNFQAGSRLFESFEMTIPADGMHTVDVNRNKLKWLVRVLLTIPNRPDFMEEYELIVLPEIGG